MRRNLDIDRLRALAILLVLVSHLPLLLPTPHSWDKLVSRLWVGVDLFFCISGFVVAKVLMPTLDRALAAPGDDRGRRRQVGAVLKSFLIRRVFRILPLSWLWLGVLLAATVAFNLSGGFGSPRATLDAVPSILTYWYNLWAYHHLADPTLASVYWSLSLEEQFYILFPLLLIAVASPRARWFVLLAMVVVQFSLSRPVWSLGWMVRTDAIALGVCLFMFSHTATYRRLEPTFLRQRVVAMAVIAAAVVLFGVATTLPVRFSDVVARFPGTVGVIALACAVLVFVASFDRNYLLPAAALRRPLDWVGTRSYGLYLAHLPAYVAAREAWFRVANAQGSTLDERYTWPVALTGLVLLVLVTELLYRYVEAPLRDIGRRMAKRYESGPAWIAADGDPAPPAASRQQSRG